MKLSTGYDVDPNSIVGKRCYYVGNVNSWFLSRKIRAVRRIITTYGAIHYQVKLLNWLWYEWKDVGGIELIDEVWW